MSTPDLQIRLSEFRAKAILRLRNEIYRAGYQNEMHGIVLPTFGDCVRYDLLTSKKEMRALGVKTLWRQQDDLARFRDPVTEIATRLSVGHNPTFEIEEVAVAPDIADTLVKSAARITLAPRVASTHIAIDGETYEIVFGGSVKWAAFHWFEESPPGWEALTALLRALAEAIEQAGSHGAANL